MLIRSFNIARRLWRGAVRMSEAKHGFRFPALNMIFGALTLLLLALLPACLIGSWAGAGRGFLGYTLTAVLSLIWLIVIAVVMSFGREDEAG
jgi:hypothetical protein